MLKLCMPDPNIISSNSEYAKVSNCESEQDYDEDED